MKTTNDRSIKITTPSFYGSHASMIAEGEFEIEGGLLENEVVLKDDKHYYVTLRNRLDNGSADPNRYASKRKVKLIVKEE